jgi:hypothetical protein
MLACTVSGRVGCMLACSVSGIVGAWGAGARFGLHYLLNS